MQFTALIDEWTIPVLAADLGLPTKNVRSWKASGSIPGEWYAAVERAAKRRGRRDITVRVLADIAEQRRLTRASPMGRRRRVEEQVAA